MANKKANSKALNLLISVALCLLSIILILNVLAPARVFTFIPNFFFGIGSYCFYIFMFVMGLFLMFLNKPINMKNPFIDAGMILTLFGVCIACSYFSTKLSTSGSIIGDYFANFKAVYPKVSYITEPGFGNVFINHVKDSSTFHFGGGVIGTLISSIWKGNSIATWIIGSLLTVIGIALIATGTIILKAIRSAIRGCKRIKNAENEKDSLNIASNKEEQISDYFSPNGRDVLRPIEQVDPKDNEFKIPKNTYAYPSAGSFEKAHFVKDSETAYPGASPAAFNPAFEKSISENPIEENEFEPSEGVENYEFNTENSYDDQEFVEENNSFGNQEEPPAPNFQNEYKEEPAAINPTPAPSFSRPAPEPIQKPKKEFKWIAPSSSLLSEFPNDESIDLNTREAQNRMEIINDVLASFGVGASSNEFVVGPSVTRYRITYEKNVSSKAVNGLVQDISIRLKGLPARFESVVEGQYGSGLEIPNPTITPVSFKEVFEKLPDVKKHPLAVPFGKNIQGDVISADFDEFPHMLVAGTTGSGKSVYVHSVICSLIMRNSPEDLRLVLIDPKHVEFTKYKDMPHLLCPIVSEPHKAKVILSKLVEEMNDRYTKFEEADGCTTIKEYNEYAKENGLPKVPYIIVFIDEYADLVESCKEVGLPVVQIGQKARACGIHMLVATQRPSTNVVTGVIKSNLPTHVALMTASSTDSVTIIGEGGAETLLGKGDMLVQTPLVSRIGVKRLQSAFIQRNDMLHIVGYLKEHYEVEYDPKFLNLEESSAVSPNGIDFVINSSGAAGEDEEEVKYQSIKEWVMSQQFISMSRIQGSCGVGFNRARRFFDRLQKEGIVAMETDPSTKACRVLMHDDYSDSSVGSDELTSFNR